MKECDCSGCKRARREDREAMRIGTLVDASRKVNEAFRQDDQVEALAYAMRMGYGMPPVKIPNYAIAPDEMISDFRDRVQRSLQKRIEEEAAVKKLYGIAQPGWFDEVLPDDTGLKLMRAEERRQPSAVAKAPGASPRTMVYCQSQYDPDE